MVFHASLIFTYADVIVGFDMTSYSVAESNGSVNLCIFIHGRSDIPVLVTINTSDGTALGIQKYSTLIQSCLV